MLKKIESNRTVWNELIGSFDSPIGPSAGQIPIQPVSNLIDRTRLEP